MSQLTRQLVLALPFCFVFNLTTLPQARSQTESSSSTKLALRAVLVLTPEFCATKFTKGSWATIRETFAVGKVACAELGPALEPAFSSLTTVAEIPSQDQGQMQFVLLPRFVDIAATTAVTAFSNRELDVLLEWTVKDSRGKTVWIETVEGSSRHHIGNMFTHRKNVKLIMADAVRDVAEQSASKMSASAELRKLAP